MRKVVLAGGTGFIGKYLEKRFTENGFHVVVVSRSPEHVSWSQADLSKALDSAELVVNLAGRSINCRHNKANRRSILHSRITTTKALGNAILICNNPPALWVNTSATGIYRPSLERVMTESELVLGSDFLAKVVTEWEQTFFEFYLSSTRQVALRTSVVLGRKGGALRPLKMLTQFGLGGSQGSGNQMFSWVHIEDYFRVLMFLVENKSLNGVVNCTSPQPIPNHEFMKILRNTLGVWLAVPAPEFAIQIGSKFVGMEPDLILKSVNVVPKRLLKAGFEFHYPTISLALTNLLTSAE